MSEDHDSGADSQRQPTNADLLEAVTGLRGAVDDEFASAALKMTHDEIRAAMSAAESSNSNST